MHGVLVRDGEQKQWASLTPDEQHRVDKACAFRYI